MKGNILKITKEIRDYLIVMSIGDGHLSKSGVLSVVHCTAQAQLLEHKYKIIQSVCCKEPTEFINNNYKAIRFFTKTTKYLRLLRRILYPNNKKTISRKILDRLEAKHLAIWWMDDGSCSNIINKTTGNVRRSISTLSTCVSKEENQIIIDWLFEKFGIKFGQRKMKNQYALICGTREGRKLREVIEPYIIPSMAYKLSK